MKVGDDDGHEVPDGEVGQIFIRGHNVMKGYWQRPEATEEVMKDGWFATGDMAVRDEDGLYAIVDRKKDMIIRGGYNVYPREVEEVLYEHPAVREAAVIGVPDDVARRGGRGRGRREGGADDRRRRAARLRQGPGRRLQVPARDLAGGRAAQGSDGQDPQARDLGPGGRPVTAVDDLPVGRRRADRHGLGRADPLLRARLRGRPLVVDRLLRPQGPAQPRGARAAAQGPGLRRRRGAARHRRLLGARRVPP